MGVRGLYSFLKCKGTPQTYNDLCSVEPLRIGIDASYFIYKFQANSREMLEYLLPLIESGHQCILIFDGQMPQSKQSEVDRRKTDREHELTMASTLKHHLDGSLNLTDQQRSYLMHVIGQHEKRGWQCSREERHQFKELLYESFVPLLKAKGEADELLASLCVHGDVDIVISGDMDLLVLGTPYLFVPQKDPYSFRVFDRDQLLKDINCTDQQFREFCAMCGTEISSRSNSIDIRVACQYILTYRSLARVQKKFPDLLAHWPTIESALLKDLQDPSVYVREEEMQRYECWKQGLTMPYRPCAKETS